MQSRKEKRQKEKTSHVGNLSLKRKERKKEERKEGNREDRKEREKERGKENNRKGQMKERSKEGRFYMKLPCYYKILVTIRCHESQ